MLYIKNKKTENAFSKNHFVVKRALTNFFHLNLVIKKIKLHTKIIFKN